MSAKHLIVIFVSVLIFLLAFLFLLSACGQGTQNSFTVEDIVNSSPSRQQWLKHPESKLTINPSALSVAALPDSGKLPLSIGVSDGDTVTAYDDLIFFLEMNSANGLGGTEVQKIDYTGAKGGSKLLLNESGEGVIDVAVSDTAPSITLKPSAMRFDFTDPTLYIAFTVAQLPEGGAVTYDPITPEVAVNPDSVLCTETGYYTVNLRQSMLSVGNEIFENGNLTGFNFTFDGAGAYTVTDIKIISIPEGCKPATNAATGEWSPCYIKSTLNFVNNTGIETVDFLYGSDCAVRKISPTANGAVLICGRIYGDMTYDSKNNAFLFSDEKANIVIFPKRKAAITYYESYDTLLSGKGSESPDGAEYWSMQINPFTYSADTSFSFYAAVAVSPDKSAEQLIEEYSGAVSPVAAKKTIDSLAAYWNSYIAENDISEYITVLPEDLIK